MAHILVIDGYAGFRETMEYCLPMFGHSVVTASDPESAYALLARGEKVDVALIDEEFLGSWNMSSEPRPGPDPDAVPMIALVSRRTLESRARLLAAGMSEVIAKPFQWAELLLAVARCTGAAEEPGPPGET